MSETGLGDLARALALLAPEDGATRGRIAHLMSFGMAEEHRDGKKQEALPVEPPSTPPPPVDPPASVEITPESPDFTAERLEPVSFERPTIERSFSDITPLPRPSSNVGLDLPVFDPLFKPLWTRNLVAAAIATRLPNGPVDMPGLVDKFARGKPIHMIPRLPQPSLFRGVQILVDFGEGMEPFARDQDHLLEEIRQAIGKESISILRFRDNPLRGAGPGAIWSWQPYELPAPGTPVLVLSDLGIGGPLLNPDRSWTGEWLAFARKLREHSCPLIAFVPYPESRWLPELTRQMTLVCWDRSTTVGTIARKVRHGHEVRL